MKRLDSAIPSATFRIFYFVSLIAWTIASVGFTNGMQSGSGISEFMIAICSLFVMASGWLLPVLQSRMNPNPTLSRAIFFFPIFCSSLLATALVLGILFGAA